MDARDQHVTEQARSLAAEFGLSTLDIEAMKAIQPAEWRAWSAMPQTKRLIGFIAEGLVVCAEAAEVADTKRRHLRGMRPGTKNDLAKATEIGRQQAEIYRKLIRAIAVLANQEV